MCVCSCRKCWCRGCRNDKEIKSAVQGKNVYQTTSHHLIQRFANPRFYFYWGHFQQRFSFTVGDASKFCKLYGAITWHKFKCTLVNVINQMITLPANLMHECLSDTEESMLMSTCAREGYVEESNAFLVSSGYDIKTQVYTAFAKSKNTWVQY